MDNNIRSYNTCWQYTNGFFLLFLRISYMTGLEVLLAQVTTQFVARSPRSKLTFCIHSLY